MTTLPTIGNYIDSSSRNYGVNSLYFECGDIRVYFSYSTPVAFHTPATGTVCRVNDWSTTTGKHLNAIEPNKKMRIPGGVFEAMLAKTVAEMGLDLPQVA